MDWVREWVSSGRSRLKTSNFNLDLSYITPRLIAMSYPAAGVEGQFRNHIDTVTAFLNERYYTEQHAQYMVYNLSGRAYNYQKFHNQVFDFPFPDHFPPTLTQLFKLCVTLHSWLNADPSHVAVVHCLAGKGRTGTVLAAYMLFAGLHQTAAEALQAFATARNTGVTMPSQRRYVQYFADALKEWRARGGNLPEAAPMQLRQIILHPPPGFGTLGGGAVLGSSFAAVASSGVALQGCRPVLQVLRAPCESEGAAVRAEGSILFSSAWADADIATYARGPEDGASPIVFQVNRPVAGDLLLRCYHLHDSSVTAHRELMFRVSFNSHFEVADSSAPAVVRFGLAQLDGADPRRMPADFSVDLCLAPATPATGTAGTGTMAAPSSSDAESGRVPGGSFWSAGMLSSLAPLGKEAFLWKRGEMNTSFRKRWCCLRYAREGLGKGAGRGGPTYVLSYFLTPDEVAPRGSIPLASVNRIEAVSGTCDGHPHCFVLRTGLRDFVFCPGDAVHPDESAREWVQLLVHAKALQLMADADESASARPHGADRTNWRTHEAPPTSHTPTASSSSMPTYTGL